AYRFRDRRTGKVAVFSGDTRVVEDMPDFARDCDLLVHDATHVEDTPRERCGSHCSVLDAIRIAERARARCLVLAHYREHQVDGTDSYIREQPKPFRILTARPGLTLELD
ncbi:MAG: hypothetical protein GY851_13800, partial [bacterium]|nr:hypothetical protein [bacterium]